MKLIIAVIQADDATEVIDALTAAGHRVTRIATTGGWLRRENVTLLVGVLDRMADHVLRLLQRTGRRRTIRVDNTGQFEHHVWIVRLLPGKTLAEAVKWAEKPVGAPPFEGVGGTVTKTTSDWSTSSSIVTGVTPQLCRTASGTNGSKPRTVEPSAAHQRATREPPCA